MSVNIEVKVLEQAPMPQPEQLPLTAELHYAHPQLEELVA